jgi:long-chain acyl-CoA synthetase
MNLADLLGDSARSHPSKSALIVASSGETIPYSEMNAEADRVAAGLAARGIRKGDRVAIGMHNVPHFAYAYFGILRAGAVVVPLNIMLTPAELGRVLKDSGAKAILAAPPFADAAATAASSAGIDVFSTDGWDALGPRVDSFDPVSVESDDLAVLAYTSGTTGEPKGAMLTHGNLLANLRQQMSIPEAHVTDEDVLFLALPLFHIFGLNVTMGLLAMNAATGLLIERFEPIGALRAIQENKVTVLFGAPTMYSAWVNTPGAEQYDLSSVRLAISGAAPLSEEVLKEFNDMFGVRIFEGYGLTETAPTLWSNRMTDTPRPGSVGKPLPDVEFKLIDEEGKDVEFGDPGEIVVRGPNVFKGYWQRAEETQQAFLDGWFRTGDIGVLDEEGYLYLVDRKRDLIIVSGFNVFPSEVEMALLQNPKIAEAAVVGIQHPYTGEAVKAYVVLASGAVATEAEIIEDVATRLARFKCPQSVEIVDDLPHLLTGKVLRRALRT